MGVMKMKILWFTVFVFYLFFVLIPSAFCAEVFLRAYSDKVIDAATVNGVGEVCSDALSVSRVEYLSVQWNAASVTGTANIRLYVTASLDGSNFMVPEGVADVTISDTSEIWKLSGVYIPLATNIKVCVKGVAANPADTVVTVWLGRQ